MLDLIVSFFQTNADTSLVSVNILFGFILIPQLKDVIIKKHYLNLWSCGLTFVGLCVCNITMASLGLWLSAIPFFTIGKGRLMRC